ncbi:MULTISPECIES: phage tail protein [Burkholderia]|uniref:phage tail protein n=1 Tax=Burkholderia TaxID=32008 RepID=UPI0008A65577|nr:MULTISPECIES: phage tail protein [Burkholderia]MDR8964793.1 hypothetical protein [Burkholderia multivorans]MDR9031897.1 hypothetical protein [Burkholderia multivorans]MDR9109491.1 hypothetical protein [Burkholderia multivorans]OFT85386.1 hypothetical protein HMPREF3115_18000 [Burkholderia sp. HMSC10F09]
MNRFRKPARQYVGEDEETIVLSGVLLAELTGGDLSLSVLEAMADQHTAWPLPGADQPPVSAAVRALYYVRPGGLVLPAPYAAAGPPRTCGDCRAGARGHFRYIALSRALLVPARLP